MNIRSNFLIGISLLFVFNLTGQEWQERKAKDGITVYTRSVPQSNFDAFKAVMEVKGEVDFARHVLLNSDRYAHIFPDTEELRILERNG